MRWYLIEFTSVCPAMLKFLFSAKDIVKMLEVALRMQRNSGAQMKMQKCVFWVKIGRKAFYTQATERSGAASLNDFIISAIEEKMKRDAPEVYAQMMEKAEA